jgi:cell division protein FtsI (penicillin-binding protein 3)
MIDPKIADQVLLMMETATYRWYRDSCDYSGYRVGGKTGTHKLRADRKGYSTNEYRALLLV